MTTETSFFLSKEQRHLLKHSLSNKFAQQFENIGLYLENKFQFKREIKKIYSFSDNQCEY